MQKKIHRLIVALSCFFILGSMSACQKYPGDSYDFSDTAPQYVTFTTTSLTLNDGTSGTAPNKVYVSTPKNAVLTSRIGFREPINTVLTIQITGGGTRTVNVTYAKYVVTQSVPITITESDFPAGVNTINGTITLTSASGATLNTLALGYPTSAKGTVITFKAYRPGSAAP